MYVFPGQQWAKLLPWVGLYPRPWEADYGAGHDLSHQEAYWMEQREDGNPQR